MNVSGFSIAPTSQTIPNSSAPAAGVPVETGSGYGLDAFLSLLSSIVEQIQPKLPTLPVEPQTPKKPRIGDEGVLEPELPPAIQPDEKPKLNRPVVFAIHTSALPVERPPIAICTLTIESPRKPPDESSTQDDQSASYTPTANSDIQAAVKFLRASPQSGIETPAPQGEIAFGLHLTPAAPPTRWDSDDASKDARIPLQVPPAGAESFIQEASGDQEANGIAASIEPAREVTVKQSTDEPSLVATEPIRMKEPSLNPERAGFENPVSSAQASSEPTALSGMKPIPPVELTTPIFQAATQPQQPDTQALSTPEPESLAPSSVANARVPEPRAATNRESDPDSRDSPKLRSLQPSAQPETSTARSQTRKYDMPLRVTSVTQRVLPLKVQSGRPQFIGQDSDEAEARVQPTKKMESLPARSTATEQPIAQVSDLRSQPVETRKPHIAQPSAAHSDPTSTAKVEQAPETNTAAHPQPSRQISLKVEGRDSASVDVQFRERGGKVQVAVRTSDHELSKSLQGDLSDLVGRLESKGFKTETWIPAAAREAPAAASQGNSGNGQNQPQHSNSGTGHQQGQQGRQDSQHRQQPHWKAQLEESFTTEEKEVTES